MWPDAKGTSRVSVTENMSEIGNFRFSTKTDLEKGHAPAELAKRYALPEILVWTLTSQPDFGFEKFLGKKGPGDVFYRDFPGKQKRYRRYF